MCLEDVKIGNASDGKMIPFTTAAAATQVLPQDNHRRCIILGAPDAGTLTYTIGIAAVVGLGFNMGAGQQPLVLDRDLMGSLVCMPVNVIGDAAGRNGAVTFTHFERDRMQ